jgi:hypothetical protein
LRSVSSAERSAASAPLQEAAASVEEGWPDTDPPWVTSADQEAVEAATEKDTSSMGDRSMGDPRTGITAG